jgi:hypothetical protein
VDRAQIEVLTERVKRIERGYVIWRVVAIGSLLAASLVISPSLARRLVPPGVVSGKEFDVVNENGRTVIRLGRYDEERGTAVLEFLDSAGAPRIVIGVDRSNAPFVSLLDPDARDQLVLEAQPEHGPAIAFRNGRSRSGLMLATDPSGVTAIGFMDKEGNVVLQLGTGPDGSARITLFSKEGKKQFEVPGK